MDIIIHGKPLDRSQRFTTGIDQGLAQNITDTFFSIGGGTIKEPEALFVDARCWQGTWTSVYTLLLSAKDMADKPRRSYFAISLVLPQKYCCLVSEVYYLLENIVRKHVIDVYLNSNFEYIVSNFGNADAFDKLCTQLRADYKNIEKNFDKSFQPQPVFPNDTYCSIYDCDSLAFVNQLKTKGRVIVTENEKTKDALASQSTKYYNEAQNAQKEVKAREVKISELKSRIAQMEEEAKQTSSRASGAVNNLKNRVSELEAANKQLSKENNSQQKIVQELGNIITQASDVLGVTKQTQPKIIKKYPDKPTETSEKESVRHWLPVINTVLIFLIVVGLFMNAKGCSGSTNIEQEAQTQIDSLKSMLSRKDQDINEKEERIVDLLKDYDKLNTDFEKYKDDINKAQKQTKTSNKTVSNLKAAPQSQTTKTAKTEAEQPKVTESDKQ